MRVYLSMKKFQTVNMKNKLPCLVLVIISFGSLFLFSCDTRSYTEKGAAEFTKGRYDNAVKYYTMAIEKWPEDRELYLGRGYALSSQDPNSEYIGDFKQYIEIGKSGDLYDTITGLFGALHYGTGLGELPDKAAELFKQEVDAYLSNLELNSDEFVRWMAVRDYAEYYLPVLFDKFNNKELSEKDRYEILYRICKYAEEHEIVNFDGELAGVLNNFALNSAGFWDFVKMGAKSGEASRWNYDTNEWEDVKSIDVFDGSCLPFLIGKTLSQGNQEDFKKLVKNIYSAVDRQNEDSRGEWYADEKRPGLAWGEELFSWVLRENDMYWGNLDENNPEKNIKIAEYNKILVDYKMGDLTDISLAIVNDGSIDSYLTSLITLSKSIKSTFPGRILWKHLKENFSSVSRDFDNITYSDILAKAALKPADKSLKYLVVVNASRRENASIPSSSMAVIPAEKIPASLEDIDRIILFNLTYAYEFTYNDGIVKGYNCRTDASLVDAKTGKTISTLGSATALPPTFAMISSGQTEVYAGESEEFMVDTVIKVLGL
jgi:tetratricopeptide (TPR) repeat protein